jgi:hypothetical protein
MPSVARSGKAAFVMLAEDFYIIWEDRVMVNFLAVIAIVLQNTAD